jgi:hypothetical protein
MTISTLEYRNAQETLDYIDHIKHEMDALLYSKTHLMYSGIHLAEAGFEHALGCIHEVIDDLFASEHRTANSVIEAWQQQEGQNALREWSTHPL